VVTVVNYDVNGEVSSIGSGFFISKSGELLTNFHVMDGAYNAEIKTHDGSQYPIETVLARSQLIDLIKVRVDIPDNQVTPVVLSREATAVADSIFVVGSPMGLEQTVSEGIISAVREMPTGAKILQLTAPISRGSSGGPVLNRDGEVIGVVTFQAARGQNLNFAISIDALDMLSEEGSQLSIAEWTIRNSEQGPALAAALCSQGSRLSIQGEYEEALTYFKKAAETNPEDPDTWYGLGSCYVGLEQPEDAIAAYNRPILQDPDNALAHFVLAMYYKTIGQYEQVVPSLLEVVRIDPTNLRAKFELGRAYGVLERTGEQIDTYNRNPWKPTRTTFRRCSIWERHAGKQSAAWMKPLRCSPGPVAWTRKTNWSTSTSGVTYDRMDLPRSGYSCIYPSPFGPIRAWPRHTITLAVTYLSGGPPQTRPGPV
jgi:hypothetical protein